MLLASGFRPLVQTIQVESNKNQKPEYKVKKNLFGNATFAIIEDSFHDGSDETVAEQVEMIRRQIIVNGGRTVSANSKANYVIHEDGYDSQVWQKIPYAKGDYMDRSIVH